MTKFSKAFGEVEVISEDAMFTVIVVKATGEQKKLSSKFAFLQDVPFGKVAKIKKAPQRELTKEEEERVAYSVEKQMKEQSFVSSLSLEGRLSYRAEKAKRTHL
jgi:hypothetical protein